MAIESGIYRDIEQVLERIAVPWKFAEDSGKMMDYVSLIATRFPVHEHPGMFLREATYISSMLSSAYALFAFEHTSNPAWLAAAKKEAHAAFSTSLPAEDQPLQAAQALYLFGNAQMLEYNYADAEQALSAAYQSCPTFMLPQLTLAEVLAYGGKFADAVATMQSLAVRLSIRNTPDMMHHRILAGLDYLDGYMRHNPMHLPPYMLELPPASDFHFPAADGFSLPAARLPEEVCLN